MSVYILAYDVNPFKISTQYHIKLSVKRIDFAVDEPTTF